MCVRNSIGAESFVTDEIIQAHSGCRVRIGNTDAEGRLVMADLLSHLRLQAVKAPNPHVFSVATLTGHAGRAVGPYSIAMDNGPALDSGMARDLERVGDLWGDPFAVSRLRREDFCLCAHARAPTTSCRATVRRPPRRLVATSSRWRFWQWPPGWYGTGARWNVRPYTHIDIGGSGVIGGDWQHGRPSGVPVVSLAQQLF